jgi:ribosomal protein L11 methyltransferase
MLLSSNPFAQSPQYWRVTFPVQAAAAGTAENAFDDSALAVSGFETDEENGIWTFEILYAAPPDMADVKRRLLLLASLHNVPVPEPVVGIVEQQDWLSQVAQDFPPLSIGRFYVHGSHVTDTPPVASIPIEVDAGAAFGSGEHGTTRCCLEALDWLARARSFAHILDMGCGSGLLAIAASMLWKTDVLAADIDPVAVRVTKENIRKNRQQQYVQAVISDGYASERIKRSGKQGRYDLIIANILARPLIKFAPDLYRHLQPGGVAVLSGLLVSQETMVLSAHLAQGLRLKKRFTHMDWCTLVLEK